MLRVILEILAWALFVGLLSSQIPMEVQPYFFVLNTISSFAFGWWRTTAAMDRGDL